MSTGGGRHWLPGLGLSALPSDGVGSVVAFGRWGKLVSGKVLMGGFDRGGCGGIIACTPGALHLSESLVDLFFFFVNASRIEHSFKQRVCGPRLGTAGVRG